MNLRATAVTVFALSLFAGCSSSPGTSTGTAGTTGTSTGSAGTTGTSTGTAGTTGTSTGTSGTTGTSTGASGTTGTSTGTAGTTGTSTGTSGTTGTSTGTAGTTGTSTGTAGTTGTGGSGTNGTLNCDSTNAKKDMACNGDCTLGCGFAPNNGGTAIGSKTCTCTNGVYSSCPCTKPAALASLTTAPACSTIGGDGTSTSLDGMTCPTMYAACVGNEPCNGSSCKGCLCLPDGKPANGMTWTCSSTNGWFTLQP